MSGATDARDGLRTRYGSDLMVDLLVELGVDLLPFAPGATFRGIHDSLVNGRPDAPEMVECLHEEISIAIAHGYAKATGRLAAAAVHDIVGLQHAAMAIYNAWCDRVPLLVLGGSGPADAAKRRPWIDWIHTANVQATQVRDYTKWDDQPASLEAVPESLARARQLALSAPQAPVYLALDSEIQEQAVPEGLAVPEMGSFPVARPLAPEPGAVREIAERLVAARRPLLAVESVGRDQATLELLVELAELLGCGAVEVERGYNRPELCLPARHPLNLTGVPLPEEPDLVLALEIRDLAVIPGAGSAEVLQVSIAGLAPKAWAADLQRVQPAALLLACAVGALLEQLVPAVRELVGREPGHGAPESARARRAARIAETTARARAEWERAAAPGEGGLDSASVAAIVGRATAGRERVVANGSLDNWVHRLWGLDHVSQYLGGSGGGGLGYGLGASIGAALAHRGTGRLVIDLQTDGDALMTPGALWTAARHRVPLLVVVANNRAWGNSLEHAERIARLRGRSTARAGLGTAIDDPAVDFAGLARSFGVEHAERASDAAGLDAALARAIATVDDGRPALVEAVMVA